MSAKQGVAQWMAWIKGGHSPATLASLLAEDAVFHSPVVHTPQRGRAIVGSYLNAAVKLLGGADFCYDRVLIDGDQAMLEFSTTIDGIAINGVDIIRWNTAGTIADFKVMIRPLKAINIVHEKMAAALTAKADA